MTPRTLQLTEGMMDCLIHQLEERLVDLKCKEMVKCVRIGWMTHPSTRPTMEVYIQQRKELVREIEEVEQLLRVIRGKEA